MSDTATTYVRWEASGVCCVEIDVLGRQAERIMRRIVGLCGFATVGKTLLCEQLGWKSVSFAGALKQGLVSALEPMGIDPRDGCCTAEEKTLIRPLMVEYGRLGRAIDPNYWVKRALSMLPEHGDIMVPDVRYANEVNHLLQLGALVVRVHRPGVPPANAEELKSFSDIERLRPALPYVINDGTPQEGAIRLEHIIAHHFDRVLQTA